MSKELDLAVTVIAYGQLMHYVGMSSETMKLLKDKLYHNLMKLATEVDIEED